MTPLAKTDLLIIVSYGAHGTGDRPAVDNLAQVFSEHLGIPVQSAFLEDAGLSVGESIQAGTADHHPERIIVLPFFLGASIAKRDNIRLIVDAAKDRWPEIGIYYGDPPSTHHGIIAAYRASLDSVIQSQEPNALRDTALLVVGRGSRDADNQAEVYEALRLIQENIPFGFVQTAFYGAIQPNLQASIQQCVESGARRIIVLPYIHYETGLYQAISHQAESSEVIQSGVEIVITPPLEPHPGILDAVRQRYQEALIALTAQLAGKADSPYRLPHTHGGISHTHSVPASFTAATSELLPARYQAGQTVSAAPMGAADLIFDTDGRVAWDQMWGSFCDLALAGGPPHRGTLLEPVAPETVAAKPEYYQQVVAELELGIRMVTQLPPAANPSPGWVGIQCADETMALWLLRAIVVENVSVRREGTVLYLPAGPDFRLEHEIRNVITVVAKTHHYWKEHLNSNNRS